MKWYIVNTDNSNFKNSKQLEKSLLKSNIVCNVVPHSVNTTFPVSFSFKDENF